MRATGKDATKPEEGVVQVPTHGQRESAPQVLLGPLQPLEPVSVHARLLLAIERIGKLGPHLQHVETELRGHEAAWVALPLEEVPAGVERLKWLEERTEPLIDIVNRAWDERFARLPGSRVPARARMRLLESLYEIVVQRDTWLVRSALARKALGRPKPDDDALMERVDPEARRRGEAAGAEDSDYGDWATMADWRPPSGEHTASAARSLFDAQYPALGKNLGLLDWIGALRAFERGRGNRSGGEEKWDLLTRFAQKAGCPPKDSENLKKEWRARKRAFPSLFPTVGGEQDELHEECSSSQLNASARGGSEQA